MIKKFIEKIVRKQVLESEALMFHSSLESEIKEIKESFELTASRERSWIVSHYQDMCTHRFIRDVVSGIVADVVSEELEKLASSPKGLENIVTRLKNLQLGDRND